MGDVPYVDYWDESLLFNSVNYGVLLLVSSPPFRAGIPTARRLYPTVSMFLAVSDYLRGFPYSTNKFGLCNFRWPLQKQHLRERICIPSLFSSSTCLHPTLIWPAWFWTSKGNWRYQRRWPHCYRLASDFICVIRSFDVCGFWGELLWHPSLGESKN